MVDSNVDAVVVSPQKEKLPHSLQRQKEKLQLMYPFIKDSKIPAVITEFSQGMLKTSQSYVGLYFQFILDFQLKNMPYNMTSVGE